MMDPDNSTTRFNRLLTKQNALEGSMSQEAIDMAGDRVSAKLASRELRNATTKFLRSGNTAHRQNAASIEAMGASAEMGGIRDAIAAKLKGIKATDVVAAREAAKTSRRSSDLMRRIMVYTGNFPKLLKGAFIPPIDFEQEAEKSQQQFANPGGA